MAMIKPARILIKKTVLFLAAAAPGMVSGNELPEWYTANRVQFHWEDSALNVERYGGMDGWCKWLKGVHQAIADSGTRAVVASGRYSAEGAWWPTGVGESFPAFGTNDILKGCVIEDYHQHGVNPIIYYRHDMDYAMQDLHPEWLARNADGSPVPRPRAEKLFGKTAFQMCQNSPFREFTKQRLIEIFERGAGGVYFDDQHMPTVCFCDNCKQAFRNKYGHAMPENPRPGTADYLEVSRFVGQTLADAVTGWKEAVKQVNPATVMIVGAEYYGQFDDKLQQSEALASAGSCNKTEFQKSFGGQQHTPLSAIYRLHKAHPEYWLPRRDLQESLNWMILRDVQHGHPPHVWVHKPDPDVEGEILHTAAAVVAHGGVAGMSLMPLPQYIPACISVFKMSDALAPFMKNARPYAWAVIHVSQSANEKLYVEGGVDELARYRHQFENLIAPVLGAAAVLREKHYPFVTVSDALLDQGCFPPETKVLIVPAYEKTSTSVKAAIDKIEAAGRIRVVKLSGNWHLTDGHPGLKAALGSDIGIPDVCVQGPENLVATYMINEVTGNLLVSLVRDWHWFWFFNRKPGNIWKEERPKQADIDGVVITSKRLSSARELWPGNREFSITKTGGVEVGGVDIARYVELSAE